MDSTVEEENAVIFNCAKEAQVQASAKLAVTLREMVNNPAFSDVAFLCNDGKRVHALRMLLVGRSDVLKSMFMNGMAESTLSEINLPEISSTVMLSVFEFLYTGTLLDYQPQSWRMACEVIVASRFFLLPELELIIRKFMHTEIVRVKEWLPKVASLLTAAVGFKALCDQMDVTLRVLVKILGSNLSDSTFVQILSEDAFDYVLANSKGKCEDLAKLSFREYLRFRQVIRWWVYHCDHGCCATEDLVDFYAPDLERAMFIFRNQSDLEEVEMFEGETASPSNEWNTLQMDEASRHAAIRLLSNIDYKCLHPVVLQKVVEPSEISCAQVISAFRFHALRRHLVFRTLEWEHCDSYGTVAQGFIIHRTGNGMGTERLTGIAVLKAAMSSPCGLFEWSFILDKGISEEDFQLGFIYVDKPKNVWKPKLHCDLRMHLGRALLVRRGNIIVNYQGAHEEAWEALPNSARAKSPLLFRFNAFQHTCDLYINGEYYKDVWTKLPSGTYYPAVSFDNTFKGRVRIELLRGFDLL